MAFGVTAPRGVSVPKVVVNWGEAGAWSQSVVIGGIC
jgi:hypothetical protein